MSEPFDPFREIRQHPADLLCPPPYSERTKRYIRRRAILRAIFPVETCALQQAAIAELESEINELRQQIWQSTAARMAPNPVKGRRFKAEVYFVRRGDMVKIGYSKNVARRIRGLEAQTPDRLELLATIPADANTEHDLHQRFADCRVRRDREWFHYTPGLQAYVESIKRK